MTISRTDPFTIATPTVTYTYDPDYNRELTMVDGTGVTTNAYYPITATPALGAGRLASVSNSFLSSVITYQYDQLGRTTNRAINGVAQAVTYDILGRAVGVTNALGSFQYRFVDATARPASEDYPNGQTNLYSYYNNLGDERLEQIQHINPAGSLLSAFGYSYNAVGQITNWIDQQATLPTSWSAGYDSADQLTNVTWLGGPALTTNYAYAYDNAGNRTLAQSSTDTNQFNYNALNQVVSATPPLTNSMAYSWDAENRLLSVTNGNNVSTFTYDGLGRRVQIIESTNDTVASTKRFVWYGGEICEERDGNDNVTRRFFANGEQITGANYYFGSVAQFVGSWGMKIAA